MDISLSSHYFINSTPAKMKNSRAYARMHQPPSEQEVDILQTMPFAIALHLLAAVIWVGGMFFAYMALRPAAAEVLDPHLRLSLWCKTFDKFFPWVWIGVILLPVTGYWMVFQEYGGFNHVGLVGMLMQFIGIPMILIFLHLYFAPYRRLKTAVAAQDWSQAGAQLAMIRKLVGFNLLLGLCLVVAGSAGSYW